MAKNYPFKQRVLTTETIKYILKTIKENKGIELFKLLAMLHINEPFIDKDKAIEYLKDMEKSGHINVNEETKEVELCQ